MAWDRPLSIAMLALGGQGGGVLTKWLVDLAEQQGFIAQSTYVAGVAQRTGATVYCVEMFPQITAETQGEPVFTPYPVPGDVDLVIAGEMAETGRAIMKGFVTPNATTLITSTHRVYSIDEKSALGDGIIDQSPVLKTAQGVSRKLYAFDMERVAHNSRSIVSAVMFGAVAASAALPFTRENFEAAIERSGKAIESNLRGFRAGIEAALGGNPAPTTSPALGMPDSQGPNGRALVERAAAYPREVAAIAAHGSLRTLDYQDRLYAEEYLDRIDELVCLDDAGNGFELSKVYARNLALQMSYEDTIRVAEQKTRATRFERVRDHLEVSDNSPTYFIEYFHPRFEEFCDTLPARMGNWMSRSKAARRILAPILNKGRNISTNKIGGYLLLSTLARLKRWRRGTMRYSVQQRILGQWRERLIESATSDYEYAVATAECIEIVRGYGETWERGMSRFSRSMAATSDETRDRADIMRRLHQAALADEGGDQFNALVDEYETK
ncbi:MAG: indolepyruvate oxidoreductase subunit beta family protein [Gammaproteobacteria bacterium]|nr:indolepyruvate oxidoreductase subunit beta family protein [Gammaproteobacteria bacterium]